MNLIVTASLVITAIFSLLNFGQLSNILNELKKFNKSTENQKVLVEIVENLTRK
ncbi:hypothetical protein J0J36_03150 [Lactococcus sp. LG1074]|uniref:hypothetical protein n=1 Tax=Lactococcus TaxID=1357 RepID=UPI001A8FAC68|nr:hypothetical protein [Lactococcus sp. LG1074]QSR02681.1 hypothetical protein J0J36_03150 [Lactococcus sp. LG1074]